MSRNEKIQTARFSFKDKTVIGTVGFYSSVDWGLYGYYIPGKTTQLVNIDTLMSSVRYPDPEDQMDIESLINCIRSWENSYNRWLNYLTWENGAEHIFALKWDGHKMTENGYKWLTRVL